PTGSPWSHRAHAPDPLHSTYSPHFDVSFVYRNGIMQSTGEHLPLTLALDKHRYLLLPQRRCLSVEQYLSHWTKYRRRAGKTARLRVRTLLRHQVRRNDVAGPRAVLHTHSTWIAQRHDDTVSAVIWRIPSHDSQRDLCV